MPIAGTVIIINSNDTEKATEAAKSVRDLEKNKSYYHVGYDVLCHHFLPHNCNEPQRYLSALYGAISGTARCGADIVADLNITDQSQYQELLPFIQDLDVVWINIDTNTEFVKQDLHFDSNTTVTTIAENILNFISSRYNHADAYTRWAPEVSPVPQVSNPGKIVLLTGSSSAGKTTLSRTIQQASDELFMHFS